MTPQTLCFFIAILLTLSGVWMRWHMHYYRMAAEEAMKDRKLTDEQVNMRMRILRQVAITLTLAGMVMLVISVTMMME